MKWVFFVIVYLASCAAHACILDPMHQTATEYEKFLKKSDFVFLGKLDSSRVIEDNEGKVQIAEFTTIKAFKGKSGLGDKVIVKNHLNSSCSRAFQPDGTAFYVFAKQKEGGGYSIGPFASFVPMSLAIENDMGLK